jgi:pyridoxamine 5'-phosphate oxidase
MPDAEGGQGLDEASVADDPLGQVRRWLADAVAAGVLQPDAMALATATPDGRPSARMVLVKAVDQKGLVFYTNRDSAKGRELAANPRAAAILHWQQLQRQVRVTGPVDKLSEEASAAYFATRPRGSQLAAWSSHQSQVVASRGALEERFMEMEGRFAGEDVPLPPWWGGYLLEAEVVECWQGRPNRLHDRLRWTKEGKAWRLERLAP